MNESSRKVSQGVRAFVESPITNLLKGTILLVIGFHDMSHTLLDDITHRHLRVGHGLVLIGLFNMLGALPPILDGIEANQRYNEVRARKKSRAGGDADPS